MRTEQTGRMGLQAKVITVSDGVVAGTREDRSGEALATHLRAHGFAVVDRVVTADGTEAVATLDRSRVWIAQTPQGFRAERLRELLAAAEEAGLGATDDAALHERFLGPVPLVEGDTENIKLTTPADLRLAAAILAGREELG